VFVEVGRTHGEPAVIDDRDLGVHVERLGAAGIVAVDGHREQTTYPVVGLEQTAEQQQDPELLGRRVA